MDITARPMHDLDLKKGTSVPGKVQQVHGGVGRNIAEGLSYLMGSNYPPPIFVSVLGDDAAGRSIMTRLLQLRLDVSNSVLFLKDVTTPSVLCALDKDGDVATCVADCSSIEMSFTREIASNLVLQAISSSISPISILVVEANLSEEALTAVCAIAVGSHIRVFFEPVSVAKSLRSLPVLDTLSFIKPNEAECRAIGLELRRRRGRELQPIQDQGQDKIKNLIPFAAEVLSAGTSTVVLTMGNEGAALLTLKSKRDQLLTLEIIRMAALHLNSDEIKSTNGAGDSLVASMIASLMRGSHISEALSYGIAGAKKALVCEGNVPQLSFEDLSSDAGRAFESLTRQEALVDLDSGQVLSLYYSIQTDQLQS